MIIAPTKIRLQSCLYGVYQFLLNISAQVVQLFLPWGEDLKCESHDRAVHTFPLQRNKNDHALFNLNKILHPAQNSLSVTSEF